MATGQFSKVLVTAAGKEMIAQSQSGKTLTFTRVALGDGLVTDSDQITTFAAVKNERMSLPIAECTNLGNGQFRIQFRLNNQDVTTGFWHREIGVMAKIDNGTEKLYAYTSAGNQGNYIYDKTTPVDERVVNVDFVVGNAENLEVVINSSIVYATVKDLEKHDDDDTAHKSAIDKHDNDADAHAEAIAEAIAKHNSAAEAHGHIRDLLDSMTGYRLKSTAYTLGARVGCHYHRDLELFCTQAGTTTAIALDTKNAAYGNVITDGSVKWTVVEKDGHPVGDVVPRPFLKLGYVKANGATVNRADYPTLVAFANANNLWTDTPATEPWKFGKGNDSTTMVLPDYRNRVIQGGDNAAVKAAGLPNITGMVKCSASEDEPLSYADNVTQSNALYVGKNETPVSSWVGGENEGKAITSIAFDAAKSNAIYGKSTTVQPPTIALIAQIKC